jgi:hypothetical protein
MLFTNPLLVKKAIAQKEHNLSCLVLPNLYTRSHKVGAQGLRPFTELAKRGNNRELIFQFTFQGFFLHCFENIVKTISAGRSQTHI